MDFWRPGRKKNVHRNVLYSRYIIVVLVVKIHLLNCVLITWCDGIGTDARIWARQVHRQTSRCHRFCVNRRTFGMCDETCLVGALWWRRWRSIGRITIYGTRWCITLASITTGKIFTIIWLSDECRTAGTIIFIWYVWYVVISVSNVSQGQPRNAYAQGKSGIARKRIISLWEKWRENKEQENKKKNTWTFFHHSRHHSFYMIYIYISRRDIHQYHNYCSFHIYLASYNNVLIK